MINWWRLEQRKPPSEKDIKQAVKDAKKLPDNGDGDHVLPPFPFYPHPIPPITHEDWNNADQKAVKLKKLQGSTARIDRRNLIWHIQHPGQSKYKGKFNTHIQVLKTDSGDLVIIDGHHRAAALSMLGVHKDLVWLLKEKDLS